MICQKCGKEFEPHYFNVKYCSDECRKSARLAQIHASQQTNRPANYIEKNCAVCGKAFLVASYSRKKYCCKTCANRASRVRARLAGKTRPKSTKTKTITCAYCGKVVTLAAKPGARKYCSDRCKHKAADARKRNITPAGPVTCPHCQKNFSSPHSLNEHIRRYHPPRRAESGGKSLEQWVREAAMCGMSYGQYRAAIQMGRSFEQLRTGAGR